MERDGEKINENNRLKGAELKRLRRLRGMTQPTLADKVGYRRGRDTIRRWENGQRWPSRGVERLLCEVLRVATDHFEQLARKGAVDRESTALAEEISELAQELAGAGDREMLRTMLEDLRRKRRLNPSGAKRAAGKE